MNPETANPIFQRYLLTDYVHSANLAGQEFSIPLYHTVVADLPIIDKLYLNSEAFDIPELAGKSHEIFVGYAVSEAFLKMNSRGVLAGCVCILISQKLMHSFKAIGQIRVDTGRIQLANKDFTAQVQLLMQKHDLDEPEELFDGIRNGDLEGIQITNEVTTDLSYAATLDDMCYAEVDSGYGDGTYPVYVGYDKEGKIGSVYIDFLLFSRNDVIEQMLR